MHGIENVENAYCNINLQFRPRKFKGFLSSYMTTILYGLHMPPKRKHTT